MRIVIKQIFFLISLISIITTMITSQSNLFFLSFIDKDSDKSSKLFFRMLSAENHYFRQNITWEEESLLLMALKAVTNINIKDVRSFIFDEIPGLYIHSSEIIIAGEGTDFTNLPMESAPPLEELLKDQEINEESLEHLKPNDPPKQVPAPDKYTVFIYHTHNRESFYPHIRGEKGETSPFHKDINITLVGQRFAEKLKEKGIGVIVDTTDIGAILGERNLHYGHSYSVSREVVQEAMATNQDLRYFIDFHRDAARRQTTTTTINGETYAKIFFVLGESHPHYSRNEQFAMDFNRRIKEKYPNLTRGIVRKSKQDGNGVYNQDLSPNSILIEIGGPENTLDELYRTADLLAEIFAEYYWEDAVEVSK